MDSSFVVVANRLPVDAVDTDGRARLAPQSRWPGHRTAPGAGRPARDCVGWRRGPGGLDRRPGTKRHRAGIRRTSAETARTTYPWPSSHLMWTASNCVPVDLSATRNRALLRGLLQRQPVAALPRRGRDAGLQAQVVGRLPARQPAVRGRDGEGGGSRARPSGSRTTSYSSCRRCSASMRPDLRIGFFLHIPFPPVELFMQLPRRVEILRGLLGADLIGFQRPLGAQNFLRLTRHLLGPAAARQRRRGRRPRGPRRRVPDLDRRRRDRDSWPRARRSRERASNIRAELGEPENRHPRRR